MQKADCRLHSGMPSYGHINFHIEQTNTTLQTTAHHEGVSGIFRKFLAFSCGLLAISTVLRKVLDLFYRIMRVPPELAEAELGEALGRGIVGGRRLRSSLNNSRVQSAHALYHYM